MAGLLAAGAFDPARTARGLEAVFHGMQQRRLHGLANPVLARPLVRAGAAGVAHTLRWAFR